MTGVELIAAERKRQVEQEGWSAEHDDNHDSFQLAHAAACYVMCRPDFVRQWWPWSSGLFKSSSRVRDLVKSGALIAAEIDRLQRALPQERP